MTRGRTRRTAGERSGYTGACFGSDMRPRAGVGTVGCPPAHGPQALDLRMPIDGPAASWGHFERTLERRGSGRRAATLLTRERTPRVTARRRAVR